MISDDPELDILKALSDGDVLKVVRGLSKEYLRTPFTDGIFGLDEKRINECIRILSTAGLICSKKEGQDHIYYLNNVRLRDMSSFFKSLIKE